MNARIFFWGFFVLLFVSFQSLLVTSYNYEHVNVTTRANITNAAPEILEVLIDQDITLNAGGIKTIYCNATIRDWNGWDDLESVNATFYHSSSFSGDVDNGNTHYTNASCDFDQLDVGNPYLASAVCSFEVVHYANNGSWSCNVSTKDLYEAQDFTDWLVNTTSVNELFALNVTDVIDYGDLAVMDFSLDIPATITNFGNVDINVSVMGYGEVEGDGLGLVCEEGSDISVENQRFSLGSGSDWLTMTALSSSQQDAGLTLLQPTDVTNPVQSVIYWRLFVPPNPFGECVGTIRFTATMP